VNAQARLRLFCFPHAGSGASVYHGWSAALSELVDVQAVQLPGRESRLPETAFTEAGESAGAISEALEDKLDLPFAFFGHSMGALLSFEVARALRRRRLQEPLYLFVSGYRAPQIPSPRPAVYHLPDEEFLEALRDLYDPPEAAMKIPELRELLLPTLRADITLCESYEYTQEAPLSCPILAFGGRDDQEAPLEALESWGLQTEGSFEMKRFAGGHFYLAAVQVELPVHAVKGNTGVEHLRKTQSAHDTGQVQNTDDLERTGSPRRGLQETAPLHVYQNTAPAVAQTEILWTTWPAYGHIETTRFCLQNLLVAQRH